MKEEAQLVTMNEIKKYQIIKNVMDKVIKRSHAAESLNISVRQVTNLVNRVKKEGVKGVIHKSRGKESHRKTSKDFENKITDLAKTKYEGFKPTFLTEKLRENEGITISKETVRKILIKAGLHKNKKAKQEYRKCRERRHCKGELIQVDGSYHNWFGDDKKWLLAAIDDASNDTYLKFAESESTKELMSFMKEYIENNGCPVSLYVDKDSIYKVARGQTIEEQIKNDKPITQFSKAMDDLGIEIIYANSPQAKGRVERSFSTHQDRLVKELKLRNIQTIEEANEYLKNDYTDKHNKKFTVKPLNEKNMHIKLSKKANLDIILSIQNERKISNDYTIRYNGRVFQVKEVQKHNVLTRNKVTIEERLDKSIHIRYKEIYLKYEEITDRVKKQSQKSNDFNTLSRKELTQIKEINEYFKNNKHS